MPDVDLVALWEDHTRFEFETRDVDATMATMVQDPYVNHVPTLAGGVGHDALKRFYKYHFIGGNPADTTLTPISRTVGADQIVDEMLFSFTHTSVIDWMLPGVPPTGRRVEVALVAIVRFRDGKVAHEHIYWDQASVLVQVGLLDRMLPVRGGEIAAQVLNPTQPMKELIRRASNKEKPLRKSYWLGGTRLSVLAGPAATEGHYDLVEGWFPAASPPALLRADLRAAGGVHRLVRRAQGRAAPWR